MIINCENISLRFTEIDDPDLKKLSEESGDLNNMSEVRLYPKNMPKEMAFRIEKENELIGEIRFKIIKWFNRKAEISILIKNEFQNMGYGKEAMKAIIKHGFEKMNIHRLEAEVITYNKSSIKLVEGLGFIREGVLREAKFSDGKYWDIYRYGLLREEYKTNIKK